MKTTEAASDIKIVYATKERIYKGGWPEDELEQMLSCMPISAILRRIATMMTDNPYWETYDPRIIDTLDSVAKKIDREMENTESLFGARHRSTGWTGE
tara:strand:+ start:53 stop:346 length:294 start_codon:yes stop_codon:yes gene_type:complete